MSRYKISVIITTDANSEKNIVKNVSKTINSIDDQSMSLRSDIELIILLPDDKLSRQMGEFYKNVYPNNCKVIFANEPTSKICECLKLVRGTYVTFVKAGSTFTGRTFDEVCNYFDFAKGIADIVGVFVKSSEKIYDRYNKNFGVKGSNVHLLQSSLAHPVNLNGLFIKTNVAVEKAKLYADCFSEEIFLAEVLERRNVFGVVCSAAKITVEQSPNISVSVEAFQRDISKMLGLIERQTVCIPSYVQNLIILKILSLLNCSENIMDIYHHPNYDYSDMWVDFSNLIKNIDDKIIMSLNTTRYNKIFLLSAKYENEYYYDRYFDDLTLFFGNTLTYNVSIFPIRIELMSICEGKLVIEGYSIIPACIDGEYFKVGVKINNHAAEIEQVKRYTDRYYFEKPYLLEKGFKLELPLDDESYDIQFVNLIDNNNCRKDVIEYMEICTISDEEECEYYYKDGYAVTIDGSSLKCEKCDEERRAQYEEKLRNAIREKVPERAEEIIEIRDYYWNNYQNKEKQIWLIMDRPDRADDNGEAFFRYMAEHNYENIDFYFILSKKSSEYEELSKIGKVVEPFSVERKKLQLMADFVISSQLAGFVYNPFNEDSAYFRDLFRNPKFIFLQHGVTINDRTGRVFTKYGRDFYGFVATVKDEYNYMLESKFHYTEKEIWLTGFPRWDRLYRDNKKKITIMPTWRKYLTTRVFDEKEGTKIWRVNSDFTESKYFSFYSDLINNEKLLDAADKYGYKICFMPHVIFLKQSDKFARNGRAVIYNYEKSYREIYAESSLLITDYSSVVFDFAYMREPIIYCQFDCEEFYKGHTVQKGYFDPERDGFGEVTYDLDSTVDQIIEYMANGCKLKAKYRERIDKFFGYYDKNCCERVYKKIIGKDKNE